LIQRGIKVWFDEENLKPGQNWDTEITKAIRDSRLSLACLSATAVAKRGFVHRELREAQRVHQEFAEGDLFIIPWFSNIVTCLNRSAIFNGPIYRCPVVGSV
jgi:hypothetical protein